MTLANTTKDDIIKHQSQTQSEEHALYHKQGTEENSTRVNRSHNYAAMSKIQRYSKKGQNCYAGK